MERTLDAARASLGAGAFDVTWTGAQAAPWALAKATGRNRNTLVVEAVRRFIEVERWQLADIEAGLREADSGDFATTEEMDALWSKYQRQCAP